MRKRLVGLSIIALLGVAAADPAPVGLSMSAGGGIGRNLDREDPAAGTGPVFRLRAGLGLPGGLQAMATLVGAGMPSARGVETFFTAGLGYRPRWWRLEPHLELSVDLKRSAPVVGGGLGLAFAPDWLVGAYGDYAPHFARGPAGGGTVMGGLELVRRY